VQDDIVRGDSFVIPGPGTGGLAGLSGDGGYLKDASTEELLHAIEVAAAGEALLFQAVTRRLTEALNAGPQPAARDLAALAMLTQREREVLALVASGLSNDQIAGQLVISPLTARTHVSRILTKTGVRARAQLVVLGYESGLVQPGRTAPLAHPVTPAVPDRRVLARTRGAVPASADFSTTRTPPQRG